LSFKTILNHPLFLKRNFASSSAFTQFKPVTLNTGNPLALSSSSKIKFLIIMTRCARCGYTVLPVGSETTRQPIDLKTVIKGLKEGGMGFYCPSCQTLWCPFCISSHESKPICGICGKDVDFFREEP